MVCCQDKHSSQSYLPGMFLTSNCCFVVLKSPRLISMCLCSGKFLFLQIQFPKMNLEWGMVADFCFQLADVTDSLVSSVSIIGTIWRDWILKTASLITRLQTRYKFPKPQSCSSQIIFSEGGWHRALPCSLDQPALLFMVLFLVRAGAALEQILNLFSL